MINPICISIFGFDIYWYGIAYIVGILIALQQCKWYAKKSNLADQYFDDFIPWAVFGILIGGRFGYVLLYQFSDFLEHPLVLFHIRSGGMSFHGGFLGVITAIILFCRSKKINLWQFSDIIAASAPIGLFFGRIANFINGEVYGRITDVPWAMIFPLGGDYLRHPSQLYEAFSEGIVLWIILNMLYWKKAQNGVVTASFFIFYGLARFVCEFFREPDYWIGQLTPGQVYSIPLIVIGISFIYLGLRHKKL